MKWSGVGKCCSMEEGEERCSRGRKDIVGEKRV